MASLGFRPPQFSEDFAWLPTWLQNFQVEPSFSATNNQIKEIQTNPSQFETCSREECRYNSCHLFLSGQGEEDTSQNSVDPSSGNVLHLCLRLSSDGESLQSQSQSQIHDLYASQALHGSNKVMLMQQIETSVGSQQIVYDNLPVGKNSPLNSVPIVVENVGPRSPTSDEETRRWYEQKIDNSSGEMIKNCLPPIGENAGTSSPTKCEDSGHHDEKFNVRHIKDANVNDAVELSIAASEALVIHDLMMSESSLEVLPTVTILEAALRIKQARLEALEDGICYSSEEIDETYFLSDLDDSIMENALVDVGLSFSDPDVRHAYGSDMSKVKDTPVLECHYGHKNGSTHIQLMAQQDNILDSSVSGVNTSNISTLVDPILYQQAVEISHVSAAAQPQVDVSSSPACISENAEGEDIICPSVADRFRSRWLGGWTVKEADASIKLKQNNTEGIPKFFDRETSFLSESADVAADENSFVHKRDTGSNIASLSSMPSEGLLDKADEGILISQEVRSSNQSLVDPLCSVVPCSISLENSSTTLAPNQDDREADAQNCFSTTSPLGVENVQRMSVINAESGYMEREAVPTITGECFEAPVRRQLASLKTYSTLLPKYDVILKGHKIYKNQQLLSEYVGEMLLSNQYVHSHSSSDQRNSKCFLPLKPEFEYSVGGDHEQNHNTTVVGSLVANHDEPAKDGDELQLQRSGERKSPLILNRRTCCRLQPSKLVKDLAGEGSRGQIVAQETVSKAFERKNLPKIKSKLKNPLGAPNLIRKRVCFSDIEVELQQNKNIQKPQTSEKDGFAIRANKRLKKSKLWSDSRTRDLKSCFTGHVNDMKRLIFHGLEFLLTGFSSRKEREIARLIQDHGGMVLLDVPSPPSNSRVNRREKSNFQQLPIVICSKKLQTTKFLYGCAVNALILKAKWLADSIAAGSVVLPEKYMILPNQAGPEYTRFGKSYHHDNSKYIFDRVGIMLHGKHSFCTKLTIIIKHGGGQVFKTLHRLFQSLDSQKISVGAIVSEDESGTSRHLRHCALERKIPMMSASWIAKSLHFGKLLPLKEGDTTRIKSPEHATSLDWSEEI